jgi:phosphate transport system protein
VTEHIVSAFEDELTSLGRKIAIMGGLVEQQLIKAIDALSERDLELPEQVVESDKQIDTLETEIEEQAILTIARRQPMALDLRQIMMAIKIASDLERIGDLAKNIAKRTQAVNSNPPKRILHSFKHMAMLALEQLKSVLDAYAQNDAAGALEVWRQDEEIDSLYNSVFRELLTYMMEDPRMISMCTHLLFGAKNIERIGDHATNIAENVHYLSTGEMISDQRPKADTTSLTAVKYRKKKTEK